MAANGLSSNPSQNTSTFRILQPQNHQPPPRSSAGSSTQGLYSSNSSIQSSSEQGMAGAYQQHQQHRSMDITFLNPPGQGSGSHVQTSAGSSMYDVSTKPIQNINMSIQSAQQSQRLIAQMQGVYQQQQRQLQHEDSRRQGPSHAYPTGQHPQDRSHMPPPQQTPASDHQTQPPMLQPDTQHRSSSFVNQNPNARAPPPGFISWPPWSTQPDNQAQNTMIDLATNSGHRSTPSSSHSRHPSGQHPSDLANPVSGRPVPSPAQPSPSSQGRHPQPQHSSSDLTSAHRQGLPTHRRFSDSVTQGASKCPPGCQCPLSQGTLLHPPILPLYHGPVNPSQPNFPPSTNRGPHGQNASSFTNRGPPAPNLPSSTNLPRPNNPPPAQGGHPIPTNAHKPNNIVNDAMIAALTPIQSGVESLWLMMVNHFRSVIEDMNSGFLAAMQHERHNLVTWQKQAEAASSEKVRLEKRVGELERELSEVRGSLSMEVERARMEVTRVATEKASLEVTLAALGKVQKKLVALRGAEGNTMLEMLQQKLANASQETLEAASRPGSDTEFVRGMLVGMVTKTVTNQMDLKLQAAYHEIQEQRAAKEAAERKLKQLMVKMQASLADLGLDPSPSVEASHAPSRESSTVVGTPPTKSGAHRNSVALPDVQMHSSPLIQAPNQNQTLASDRPKSPTILPASIERRQPSHNTPLTHPPPPDHPANSFSAAISEPSAASSTTAPIQERQPSQDPVPPQRQPPPPPPPPLPSTGPSFSEPSKSSPTSSTVPSSIEQERPSGTESQTSHHHDLPTPPASAETVRDPPRPLGAGPVPPGDSGQGHQADLAGSTTPLTLLNVNAPTGASASGFGLGLRRPGSTGSVPPEPALGRTTSGGEGNMKSGGGEARDRSASVNASGSGSGSDSGGGSGIGGGIGVKRSRAVYQAEDDLHVGNVDRLGASDVGEPAAVRRRSGQFGEVERQGSSSSGDRERRGVVAVAVAPVSTAVVTEGEGPAVQEHIPQPVVDPESVRSRSPGKPVVGAADTGTGAGSSEEGPVSRSPPETTSTIPVVPSEPRPPPSTLPPENHVAQSLRMSSPSTHVDLDILMSDDGSDADEAVREAREAGDSADDGVVVKNEDAVYELMYPPNDDGDDDTDMEEGDVPDLEDIKPVLPSDSTPTTPTPPPPQVPPAPLPELPPPPPPPTAAATSVTRQQNMPWSRPSSYVPSAPTGSRQSSASTPAITSVPNNPPHPPTHSRPTRRPSTSSSVTSTSSHAPHSASRGWPPSVPPPPVKAESPKLTFKHWDLLYIDEGHQLRCRLCVTLPRNPGAAKARATFPKDTNQAILFEHSQQEHPVACNEMAKLSTAKLMEMKARIKHLK